LEEKKEHEKLFMKTVTKSIQDKKPKKKTQGSDPLLKTSINDSVAEGDG